MTRVTLTVDLPLALREARAREVPTDTCRLLVRFEEDGGVHLQLATLAFTWRKSGSISCVALSHYLDDVGEEREARSLGVEVTRLPCENSVTGSFVFRCEAIDGLAKVLKTVRAEALALLPSIEPTDIDTFGRQLSVVSPTRPFEAALLKVIAGAGPVIMYESTHPSFDVLGTRDVILGLAEKSVDAQRTV